MKHFPLGFFGRRNSIAFTEFSTYPLGLLPLFLLPLDGLDPQVLLFFQGHYYLQKEEELRGMVRQEVRSCELLKDNLQT